MLQARVLSDVLGIQDAQGHYLPNFGKKDLGLPVLGCLRVLSSKGGIHRGGESLNVASLEVCRQLTLGKRTVGVRCPIPKALRNEDELSLK